jgi:hypothetical protein
MKIIITENQVDKIKSKIHEYVKKYGIEKSRQIFGDKVLFTIGFNNNPMEYLYMFKDLEVVPSNQRPHLMLFRYKPGENLIVYDKDEKDVYVDNDNLWSQLEKIFNLNYIEVMDLVETFMNDVYQISDITPYGDDLKHYRTIT